MSNDNASTEAMRSQRDGNGASGFLSMASNSLKRSPSKKHESQPSKPMPNLDDVLFGTKSPSPASSRPSTATPTQYRPGIGRTPTAPVTLQTLKYAVNVDKDNTPPQFAVEATMLIPPIGASGQNDSNLTHSKTAPAALRRGDSLPLGNGGDTSADTKGLAAVAQASVPPSVNPLLALGGPNNPNPSAVYDYIRGMASKRISTLDYMRKASVNPLFFGQEPQAEFPLQPRRASILVQYCPFLSI